MKPVLTIMFIVLLTTPLCHAQTEIEGAVSGVWTSEDSPYIVIDSTWVPEGDSLTIGETVTVIFQENQGLYIYGNFGVNGGFGVDAVLFEVEDSSESWGGLRLYNENEAVLNHLDIVCPGSAIFLDDGYTLTMNHCAIETDKHAISSLDAHQPSPILGVRLNFSYCKFDGGDWLYTIGSTIIADHSTFNFSEGELPNKGFYSSRTFYTLTNCIVKGRLVDGAGKMIIEDCEFYGTDHGEEINVQVRGVSARMLRTYVEGKCTLMSYDYDRMDFEDNIIDGRVEVSRVNANILRCWIRGSLSINGIWATLRNTMVADDFSLSVYDSAIIDSCIIGYEYRDRGLFRMGGTLENGSIKVTRSFFKGDFSLGDRITFDHNTIIFAESGGYSISCPSIPTVFTNNIMYTPIEYKRFMARDPENPWPVFKYNCIYGSRYIADNWGEEYEPDSTNILSDPQLEWFGYLPLLTTISPCIDRGDPDAPDDPDGTRSDIGARAFYQWRNGVKRLPELNDMNELIVKAYPNPFNNSLEVSFALNAGSSGTVELYDLLGRNLYSKQISSMSGQNKSFIIPANNISTGTYLLKVTAGEYFSVSPITCIK